MITVEQMIALGMVFYKPFRTIDNVTGSSVETGTILTCHRFSGKDDYEQVYFVVEDVCGDNLSELIITDTDEYLEAIKFEDISNDFKAGILLKID